MSTNRTKPCWPCLSDVGVGLCPDPPPTFFLRRRSITSAFPSAASDYSGNVRAQPVADHGGSADAKPIAACLFPLLVRKLFRGREWLDCTRFR